MADPTQSDRPAPPAEPAFNVPPATPLFFLLLAAVFALVQLNPGGIALWIVAFVIIGERLILDPLTRVVHKGEGSVQPKRRLLSFLSRG